MKRIKKIREELKLTKLEVAKMANVSLMSYYRYESGERVPDAHTATLIARALHTTVEELWGCNLTA